MSFVLDDKWLWDFWFAKNGPDYHLFYLQADRSLKNADARHFNVSIGHAVSQDLKAWQRLPDVMRPSADTDAWDSKSTWTGSVIRYNEQWYMFYTGTAVSEKGLIQRIGFATSEDLITWRKQPQSPVIEADPRWYERLDLTAWFDEAWRDPWLFQDPADGVFHAFITARAKEGAADGRGVIAHAQSHDLLHWEVLPPMTPMGRFGQMEVPQLVHIENRYYLLFSTGAMNHSAAFKHQLGGQQPVTGTHYLVADNMLGPFDYLTDSFMVGDAHGSLYSGKLIQGPDKLWYFMAFEHNRPDGIFVGALSDPMPVHVDQIGRLHVAKAVIS